METENRENVAPKKGNLILWIGAVLAVICVFGFLGYKFLLGESERVKTNVEQAVQAVKTPAITAPVKEEIVHSDLQFGEEITPEKAEKISEPDVANLAAEITQQVDAENNVKTEPKIAELEKKLDKQNQNLLMFLSAQNISNSYHEADTKALQRELDFFKQVAGSDVEFQGKIDLLEYSLEGGLTSAHELANDLDAIAKSIENAQEKTFWQNLQDSIFGLVKITKLDEKAEGDYPKVLLAKKALKDKDFNEAIRLVDAIDKKHTKAWLDKAYKQQRMQESVVYLLEMTRKKLVQ